VQLLDHGGESLQMRCARRRHKGSPDAARLNIIEAVSVE
jgi:hypothetical protein